MSRVTLRLPDGLHERLRDVSHRTGASLNQVIVATLRDVLTCDEENEPASQLLKQTQLVRTALADPTVDVDTTWFDAAFRPETEVPTREELARTLPRLTPSLSATVIVEREDRV
ncbi:MAG TPA: hypothetical protein VNL16_00970 [Chloroflexota bacterium]|nr:hypothetical protein [Chloroflexota bacterium]